MFGQYAAFIIPAYAITVAVFVALTVWTVLDYRARRAELARLEEQGLRRRSQQARPGGRDD